jgi:hypothetical protein
MLNTPILQTFIVKSNLDVNISALVNGLIIKPVKNTRPGTIVALKHNNLIKGTSSFFKTNIGFKNACHLVISNGHKMVHVKITSVGTFQVINDQNVEKIIYKLFLTMLKIPNCIQTNPADTPYKLELVIVPILKNYVITLDPDLTHQIFKLPKDIIIQKFINQKFICFMMPKDTAIHIKMSFIYEEYCKNPVKWAVWKKHTNKGEKSPCVKQIEYDSYNVILNHGPKNNKYVTLRLYHTGKLLISGFDEILIQKCMVRFYNTLTLLP